MLSTSIIAELVRSQPRLIFWVATLAQAALWWIVPSTLYSSPPGDLPLVIAVGHQFVLGSAFGPPLAFWTAELAFDLAGTPGVYLLAQACVVLAYFAVFTLARAIVGIHHATFAILLMAGVSTLAAPTPDFGPAILAMPFTAFALLNLWRAAGERRQAAWYRVGVYLGLLLLTSHAGLVVVAAIAGFLGATTRGRKALRSRAPWLAVILMIVVVSPHLLWLRGAGRLSLAMFSGSRPAGAGAYIAQFASVTEMLLLAHAGLLVLAALSRKWFSGAGEAPVYVRGGADPFGRRFVYFFATVPALIAVAVAVLAGGRQAPGYFAPFVLLPGLAVVVLAGNAIAWQRSSLAIMMWALLLVVPPLAAAAAVVVLPWLGISGIEVGRPATAMGRFVADNFERRTGMRLTIVAGDPRTASLVALGSPARPSLYLDAAPSLTPWVTADDIQRKGAVVVWPNADTRAQVPPAIAARFPGLVADVPRAFERLVEGRLPPLWLGWGVVRPQDEAAKP